MPVFNFTRIRLSKKPKVRHFFMLKYACAQLLNSMSKNHILFLKIVPLRIVDLKAFIFIFFKRNHQKKTFETQMSNKNHTQNKVVRSSFDKKKVCLLL